MENKGILYNFKKYINYILLVLLALCILIPVAWVFMASIKADAEFYGSPWALPLGVHLQNFADAWNTAKMGTYFLNSIVVTGIGIAILLVVALPAAYVLARFQFKLRKTLNLLFMMGLFINMNYIVVPVFLMFVDADKAMKSIFGAPFFLNNLFVLALVYASMALPFTIYLLSSYFITLPKDYEEAAYVDGASNFSTMVKIIIPMAQPSIITVVLFNFLSMWNEYILSMTLLNAPNGTRTLPVGLMNLMKSQNAAAHYGQMYAGLVLVILPALVMYIFFQKRLTQGMTVGGLKG